MTDPSSDSLPHTHPPGRSRTRSAWGALAALFILLLFILFQPLILQGSVRAVLWATRPFTHFTIISKKLHVAWGKPLEWDNATLLLGQPPYQSKVSIHSLQLTLSSPWDVLWHHQPVIKKLQAAQGKGLFDLRTNTSTAPSTTLALSESTPSLKKIPWLPASLFLNNISLQILADHQQYLINNLSCLLPQQHSGNVDYDRIVIKAGDINCHLHHGKCEAFWSHPSLTLKHLSLSSTVLLDHLQLLFYPNAISFGLRSKVFEGQLRADGLLCKTQQGFRCDSAILGEKLPMQELSTFFGLPKKISGILREGRLTFRGTPLHMMDAEASLRMFAENVRLEEKGWASLAVAADLIDRKVSIRHFKLKQHDNQVAISGKMTLSETWNNIVQSPFALKLKANISDASQLADLIGSPWERVTGQLFADGEIHGALNHAEGYLNAQGISMTGYGLPIDSAKLELLFHGDQTQVSNISLWNNNDYLQLSGSIQNSWPHTYQGKGTITLFNLVERLSQLGIKNPYFFEKGNITASWNGSGSATTHQGFCDFSLKNLLKNDISHTLEGSCSYTPEKITFPRLTMLQEDLNEALLKLTTQLSLSSKTLTTDNLILSHQGNKVLSGHVTLPFNGISLLQGTPWSESYQPNQEVNIDLTWQHLPLQLFSSLYSIPLEGIITGNFQAKGTAQDPSLNLHLEGKNITPNSSAFNNNNDSGLSFPKLSELKLLFHTEKEKALIDSSISLNSEKPLTLQGSLPTKLLSLNQDHGWLKFQHFFDLGLDQTPFDLKLSLPSLSLDPWNRFFLPSSVSLSHGEASGNLSLKGTVSRPLIEGDLFLKAAKLKLGTFLSPLHHLQAKYLFSQGSAKLEEASAYLGEGKITAQGSSLFDHGLHLQHDYQLQGHQLLLHQAPATSLAKIIGNTSLKLQGDESQGSLKGSLSLTAIRWNPHFLITPFLAPPGILFPLQEEPSANIPSSWTTDLLINTSTPLHASPLSDQVPGKILSLQEANLHLTGSLISPTAEGTVAVNNLKLSFPQTTMLLPHGVLSFTPTSPWHPQLEGSVTGKIAFKRITATFHSSLPANLTLESKPITSPAALALLLGLPKDSDSYPWHPLTSEEEYAEAWVLQLPYLARQLSLFSPTSLPWHLPSSSNTTSDLGFSSQNISYSLQNN